MEDPAIERDEERDDRIPRIGSPRPHQIAAHFTLEHVTARLAVHQVVSLDRLIVCLRDGFERTRVEHTQVAAQAKDHQPLIQCGHGACGDRISGVNQHLEPFTEALDIELLVVTWFGLAPQIEVEERRELRRRRRRDEFAARIEPAMQDELMQFFRRDKGNHACEATIGGCRHGPVIIAVLGDNKQS